MKATNHQAPKVIIGSNYRPERLEKRTPTTFSSLRPDQGLYGEMLQRGLLSRGLTRMTDRAWRIDGDAWFIAALYVLAAAFAAMAMAGWLPGQGA